MFARTFAVLAALAVCARAAAVPLTEDLELEQLERQSALTTALPVTPSAPAPSPSFVPSSSPTKSATPTPSTTMTATMTPSTTPTATPSTTTTATASMTPSNTASATPSISVSVSPGSSTTPTASATPSISTTATASVTPTVSPSVSMTASATPSVSVSSSVGISPSPSELPAQPLAEQITTSPSPAASVAVCFPGSATVELENGSMMKMADLSVGVRVAVGAGKYSEVFMFTHKMGDVKHQFVQISTESGTTLRLTAGHYLPLNGRYQPASTAVVGDTVRIAGSKSTRITELAVVEDVGLFNPQTTHGDILVSGVVASTYTTAVPRSMAHAALAPLRAICDRLGLYATFLDGGADQVASLTSALV